MASGNLQLTLQERKVLEKRFEMLKKDDEDVIKASVLKEEPYDSEPFCKHLAMKNLSGRDGIITKESFYGNIDKWQYHSLQDKLRNMFSLMKSGDSVTQPVLAKVLAKTLPGYSESEYKLLSETMIKTLNAKGNKNEISLDEFVSWITSHISEEKLLNALDFQITSFDH